MSVSLPSNTVWNEIHSTIAQLNLNEIALNHIASCNYQINGYWDNDIFYDQVLFDRRVTPYAVRAEFITSINDQHDRILKIVYDLIVEDTLSQHNSEDHIGELILVLDQDFDFVDENWIINISSSFVTALKQA